MGSGKKKKHRRRSKTTGAHLPTNKKEKEGVYFQLKEINWEEFVIRNIQTMKVLRSLRAWKVDKGSFT